MNFFIFFTPQFYHQSGNLFWSDFYFLTLFFSVYTVYFFPCACRIKLGDLVVPCAVLGWKDFVKIEIRVEESSEARGETGFRGAKQACGRGSKGSEYTDCRGNQRRFFFRFHSWWFFPLYFSSLSGTSVLSVFFTWPIDLSYTIPFLIPAFY